MRRETVKLVFWLAWLVLAVHIPLASCEPYISPIAPKLSFGPLSYPYDLNVRHEDRKRELNEVATLPTYSPIHASSTLLEASVKSRRENYKTEFGSLVCIKSEGS